MLAEEQDLRIFGDGVRLADAKGLNDATDQLIQEAERQGVAGWPSRSWLVKLTIAFLDSTLLQ